MKNNYDVIIIGGGPAGLAAAISAYDSGVSDVLIIEREARLGGILNQCIHNGFGLTRFKESLSGPEYARRFEKEVRARKIEIMLGSTVLSLSRDKSVTVINEQNGVFVLQAKAIILAMGCRERSRGALNIAGSRPAGIYSAGTAQKYVNINGFLPGKEVVILGSGDIGLIMARRMTLEGAKVHAVCEIMPYSSGLKRNIEQCLNDFNIPLYLEHTITKIEGKDRVSGVTISKVDADKKPIPGTEKHFSCDTVLFSVGLIPENEISKTAGITLAAGTRGPVVYQNRETEAEGIFACGNVLQVHDLVDFVSKESEVAGKYAAEYVLHGGSGHRTINCSAGKNISYVLPQKIDTNIGGDVELYFRVRNTFTNCKIIVAAGGNVLSEKKKRVCVPGEMETLLLKEALVNKADGDITVWLEEEGV